ncbi:MAG: MBL fold metallo-hydrolase [Thermodesulfobacteriota bacterium]
MMEIIFLGVGEAFDEKLPNTSILIRNKEGISPVTLLLDCGFTAPPQFWREEPDADILDGIWISHFHGDHCLGIPALLVRFWEEGRKKVLTLLGPKGIDTVTRTSLNLAYPGMYDRLGYTIQFLAVEPKKHVNIFGLTLRTALNSHSQRDLALRIDTQKKSIYYSGDGKATPESMALAAGSDLIIHEAFNIDSKIGGHGSIMESIEMAKACKSSHLALVHIQREVRSKVIDEIQGFKQIAGSLNLMVPEPGFRMAL